MDRRKPKGDSKKEPPPKTMPSFDAELSTGETSEVDVDVDMDVPSPSSSISFSSLPRGGGKGALNTLMHEIDENDDDDEDIGTPFQSDPFTNHHSVSNNSLDKDYSDDDDDDEDDNSSRASSIEREKEKPPDKTKEKTKPKEKVNNSSKKNSSSNNGPKKNSKSERKSRNSESSGGGGATSNNKSKTSSQSHGNNDYLIELVLLHRKLMSLRNRDQIQRIVDLIGDTDHFQISDNSFDFDLCSLDKTTVKKLQDCVAPL